MKDYWKNEIYCPMCERLVGTYDGKSRINPQIRCKHCNKLVVYDIETGKTESKTIPQRMYGSGVRFY